MGAEKSIYELDCQIDANIKAIGRHYFWKGAIIGGLTMFVIDFALMWYLGS